MKGYKVTDRTRAKLIGVACSSLSELLTKGRQKLGMAEEAVAALDDGTILDDEDYFRGLPPQTVVVLYRKHEEVVTGVDLILNALRSVNTAYLGTGSKAKEFLIAKTNELMKLLEEAETEGKSLITGNTPQEDPDWFSGLETNARTKDEYMFKKSQDRIRGYFYKFQEDLKKNKLFAEDPHFREVALECLRFLRNRLKEDEYFGCYFDRRCAAESPAEPIPRATDKKRRRKVEGPSYDRVSYCDSAGRFVCEGRWRLERCEFGDHQINPYLSREARLIFSTWNLDHRIERSRSVAPTLVSAIQACGKSQSVNFLYFYQLLFTKLNLKLVHVVCHEKSVHDVSCDPRFVYVTERQNASHGTVECVTLFRLEGSAKTPRELSAEDAQAQRAVPNAEAATATCGALTPRNKVRGCLPGLTDRTSLGGRCTHRDDNGGSMGMLRNLPEERRC